MSLCRYLPTPSDRMAILWSLLAIKDAVVLEYGPAGTTHYSMILYGNLGVEQNNKLFTTHMSEDDVVMGDVSRLEKAIFEVDRCSNAKVIFVVASSISAIIGTDIKGVCNAMQDQVRAKLVCFDQGGLKGDYSIGISETYKLICKEIVKKNVEKKSKTYNILGISLGQYRARSDAWEIRELMREAFDYESNATLCEAVSIDDLENLGAADINLCLKDETLPAAKILHKKFSTPQVNGCPYGYRGTIDWLKQISQIIDCPINPKMLARLEEKAKDINERGLRMRMMRDETPMATIVGDYDRVIGIRNFLKEIHFEIKDMLCDHSPVLIQDKDQDVKFISLEKERIDILEACQKQFVLGDDVSIRLVNESNTTALVSAPFFKGARAHHLPIVGEKGADFIYEKMEEYFDDIIQAIRR